MIDTTRLTKQDRMLAYMFALESRDQVFNINENSEYAIHALNVAKDKASLSSLLNILKNKRYIAQFYNGDHRVVGAWGLTPDGDNRAKCIFTDNPEMVLPSSANDYGNDEDVEDESVEDGNLDIYNKNMEIAKKNLDLANNILANLSSSLTEIDNLKQKNAELEDTVHALRAQLAKTSNALYAKTKQCEHLEDSIDKLANNFTQLRDWAIGMKNGAN